MIPLGVLAGRRAVTGGGSPLTLEYVVGYQNVGSVTGSGPYTITASVQTGVAAADRTLVVAYVVANTISQNITSMTIGGVSATLDASTANRYGLAIGRAHVPSGTGFQDLTVTIPANIPANQIAIYRITGASVAVTDTDVYNATSATTSTSVTAVAGGCVIAVSYYRYSGVSTWTGGVTENYRPWTAFASKAVTANGTEQVDCTWGGSSNSAALTVAYEGA